MIKAMLATILLLGCLLVINALPITKLSINDDISENQNRIPDIPMNDDERTSTPAKFRPFAEVLDLLDRLHELQSEINASPLQGGADDDSPVHKVINAEDQQQDSRDETLARREKLDVPGLIDLEHHVSRDETIAGREKREAQGLDLSKICTTAECLRKLVEYLTWRKENGYPDYTGVWKVGK